jgi:DGQHR domain-containing protein
MAMHRKRIDVPAIRVRQGAGREVFSFAVDGKVLSQFSAISRIRGGGVEDLKGYQRPEVMSHIAEIQRYLESNDAILPNAIVLALTPSVIFNVLPGEDGREPVVPGVLTIEWNQDAPASDRPAWVVDGQQRLAAIREASVASFPVCVTAFITGDEALQREQFLLLNNTKPLPKSLIYELLPGTEGELPSALEKKRLPAALTRMLNELPDSPFKGRIKMATNPVGVVRDNSIMRMLEHSLTDGALLRIRLRAGDEGEKMADMVNVVQAFWSAVRDTWPEAWKLPPRKSRLLHGAGLIGLGFVMDEMAESRHAAGEFSYEYAKSELRMMADQCAWTAGRWPLGEGRELAWNEIQNTNQHIDLLSNFLLRLCRSRMRMLSAASGRHQSDG